MPSLLFDEDMVAKMAALQQSRSASLPRHRLHKYGVQLEWVTHTRPIRYGFMLFVVVLTSFYLACLFTQYGTLEHFPNDTFRPEPFLDEGTLTRVIMIEWLVLAFVLLVGVFLYRRIFMPFYIFLAILATNGTLVLFVIKMKQFWDGKIRSDDLSLNLTAMLLLTATVHNFIYIYALHLYQKADEFNRLQRHCADFVVSHEEEKKDVVDNFV